MRLNKTRGRTEPEGRSDNDGPLHPELWGGVG